MIDVDTQMLPNGHMHHSRAPALAVLTLVGVSLACLPPDEVYGRACEVDDDCASDDVDYMCASGVCALRSSAPDAGNLGRVDGGGLIDSGVIVDSGASTDGGTDVDSGAFTDAGASMDAGLLVDGGNATDAGVFDAGVVVPDVPYAWHCAKDAYTDDVCDCGCGAADPACEPTEPTTCDLTHCGPGFVVGGEALVDNHALCAVPTTWTCADAWYQDADCDCGCDAVDLGCADFVSPLACDFTWCGDEHSQGGVAVDGDLAMCETPEIPVVVLSSHDRHTCAQLVNDDVKCWGRNEYGQLGIGDASNRGNDPGEMGAALPFVDLGVTPAGNPFVAARVRTGVNDTCVLSTTGHVKCFGRNEFGIAGRGDTATWGNGPNEMGAFLDVVPLGTDVIVTELVLGREHGCARVNSPLVNNRVKCWGRGDDGRLGYGDLDGSGLVHRGNNPGEMNDALPYVNLGTTDGTPEGPILKAKRLFAGGRNSCAILDDDTLKCWGLNDAGQLGLGDNNSRGNQPGEMGNALPRVPLPADRIVVDLALGHDHMCALLDDGTLRCWGHGGSGRTGHENTANTGQNPSSTPAGMAPVNITDDEGTPLVVVAVTAGEDHTCVIVDTGPNEPNVKCWGGNGVGELGHGDVVARGGTPGSMGAALPFTLLGTKAIAISAGLNHTCAVLDDGTVKCWGGADGGALGNGSGDSNFGNQPGEMDAQLPVVAIE